MIKYYETNIKQENIYSEIRNKKQFNFNYSVL